MAAQYVDVQIQLSSSASNWFSSGCGDTGKWWT
jgi:hypothetical protein